MHFVTENVSVEVKLRPMNPANIVKRPKVIIKDSKGNTALRVMRPKFFMGVDNDTGKMVFAYPKLVCPKCDPSSQVSCDLCHGSGTIDYFTNFEKMLMVNGEEVSKDDITYWGLKEDGIEEEYPIFERSEALKVRMEIPKSKIDDFYFDGGWAELEAPLKKKKVQGETVKVMDKYAIGQLWKEAERYVVENIIGLGRFVKAKSHKEWFFVAVPRVMENNQFGWLIGYTTCKKVQKCLMPIPKGEEVAPEKTVPAKSYLPEIEAMAK